MDFDSPFFAPPPLSQRQEQIDHTRARVLEEAVELIRQGGEEALTMRAVARKVGVTERTVHRHFETRDELINAVWQRTMELVVAEQRTTKRDDLSELPRTLFPALSKHARLARAFLYSRAKRNLKWDPAGLERIVGLVEKDLEYLDEKALRRRAAVIMILSSPYTWELMRRWWGFSGTESGKAASEAIEILLDRRLAY
jgi:AcrR family transcriptional regulator